MLPPSTERQAPASTAVGHIPRLCRDSSLGTLTYRFGKLLKQSVDGVLDLNVVAEELNVSKRRIYDVTNVLEAVHIIKKKSKNQVQLLGPFTHTTEEDLKDLCTEEKKLDRLIFNSHQQLIKMCKDQRRFAYLTYEDIKAVPALNDQTVLVIKAPEHTKMEVPHPDESFQIHLRSTGGPIEVFVCSDEDEPMDDGAVATTANGCSVPSVGIGSMSNRPHLLFHVPFKDYASEVIKSLFGLTQPSSTSGNALDVSIQAPP